MTPQQRQSEILKLIRTEECSSVKELCAAVYASEATIRRDLHALEEKGLIRLLYGNIILQSAKPQELPLAFRENLAKEAKRTIARYAASIIPPNSSVMLDSSSNALLMADFLPADQGITVFTNCAKTAIKLCDRGLTVYLVGGQLSKKSYDTSGAWTDYDIGSICVDYLFFSSSSIDNTGMIGGQSESGIQMRRQMIEHARNQYYLCNSEKLGAKATFMLCNANKITGVITDTDLSHIPDINILTIADMALR